MHHFVTEMCTHVHISVTNGALRDMGLVHSAIHAIGLLHLKTTGEEGPWVVSLHRDADVSWETREVNVTEMSIHGSSSDSH